MCEQVFVEKEVGEAKLIQSQEVLIALIVRSILLIDLPFDLVCGLCSLCLCKWLMLLQL